ncbi:MAG: hypothetical protein LC745_03850 [Planctomycetia bacterium]|nr:hypothetical protein [Planctomycetia bacterium]
MACYTACEVGQDQFYDEVTPHVGPKVAVGSLILAALATWIRPSFDTIFTANIAWTVLQAIVWCLVFIFIFEFHPWHALAISLVIMVLVSGLATMGVESLTRPTPTLAPVRSRPGNQPVRKSLNAVSPPAGQGAAAK